MAPVFYFPLRLPAAFMKMRQNLRDPETKRRNLPKNASGNSSTGSFCDKT
jgi:hypothetical protein